MSLVARLTKAARLVQHPATWRALALTRTATANEHFEMLRFARPRTVLDVGANKGQFALAVRMVAPDARIIAFEPLDAEAGIFERNLMPATGIELHRVALGSLSERRSFFVTNRRDSSSLLRPGTRQNAAFGVRANDTIEVAVERLDSIVRPGALTTGSVLLKIDVQGAEADVIAGASAILPDIRYIYAEASFVELYEGQPLVTDLIVDLSTRGFVLRGIYNQHGSPHMGPLQADLLFERCS